MILETHKHCDTRTKLFKLDPKFCQKCKTPTPPDKLVSGTCIFCEPENISELTHMECKHCGEWKTDFAEIELSMPDGKKLFEYCSECCDAILENNASGYVNPEE